MRPLRTYLHRYVQVAPDAPPGELTIFTEGHTPCRARAAAFVMLEQQLERERRLGKWKLMNQVPVPPQGSRFNRPKEESHG